MCKRFEILLYWNDYKAKTNNKNAANEHRRFLESNLAGVTKLFILAYLNRNNDVKKFKALRYYLPKGIINNYSVIINGKNFYDQPIDSDINQYEE